VREKQVVVRYIVVGAMTTIFHVLFANISLFFLSKSGLSPAVQMVGSNSFAFICCSFGSYFFYAIWTFDAGVTRKNISNFKVVAVFSFLAISLFSFLFERLEISPYLLSVFVTLPLAAINFFIHRYWTFDKRITHNSGRGFYKPAANETSAPMCQSRALSSRLSKEVIKVKID
jgi:putative flippase GtrA